MRVAFYTNKNTSVHLKCSSKIRCAIHCKGFLKILRIGSPLYGRWGGGGRERECTDIRTGQVCLWLTKENNVNSLLHL